MKKWFYERSKFDTFKSNTTYHDLLSKTDSEFIEWARLLRKEVTTQWDEYGTPPVIGKDEEGIIKSLSKLRKNPCEFLEQDKTGDEESLGKGKQVECAMLARQASTWISMARRGRAMPDMIARTLR